MSESVERTSLPLSWSKFHPVFGRALKIAFETSFPPYSTDLEFLEVPEGVDRSQLLFASESVMRVYHPAYADGDVSQRSQGTTMFVPWVDEQTAQHHRLVFRRHPRSRIKAVFARFGERDTFMFGLGRDYISLDFQSKTDSFSPVYIRMDEPGKPSVYLAIYATTAGSSETADQPRLADAVVVLAKRVEESEVPPHLQKLQ